MIWDEMRWYDICSCSPFKYQRSNKPRRSPRNMCAMPWKHWTVIHSGECSSAHIHIGIPLCLDWKAWDGWLIMTETHVTWSWHWLSTDWCDSRPSLWFSCHYGSPRKKVVNRGNGKPEKMEVLMGKSRINGCCFIATFDYGRVYTIHITVQYIYMCVWYTIYHYIHIHIYLYTDRGRESIKRGWHLQEVWNENATTKPM